jgi:RNA polymerase sigma-70 factor, ECF subfamily
MTTHIHLAPEIAAGPVSALRQDGTVRQDDRNRSGPAHEDAMEAICRLHRTAVYRYLLRVTLGDGPQAEDLLQETLLRAWLYLQDHAVDVQRLRPWLYTVARRVAIDAARARKARPEEVALTGLGSQPAGHDDIERMLIALTVRRGLMSLTSEHRKALIEVFYRGRTAKEAAAALGVPEGTVRSRVFYALRALAAITS